MAQVETLKKCFDSMDKEQNGSISATAIQMIFKMLGVTVQKAGLGNFRKDNKLFQIYPGKVQNQFWDTSLQMRPLVNWGIKWMPTSLNLATFAKWQLVLCSKRTRRGCVRSSRRLSGQEFCLVQARQKHLFYFYPSLGRPKVLRKVPRLSSIPMLLRVHLPEKLDGLSDFQNLW